MTGKFIFLTVLSAIVSLSASCTASSKVRQFKAEVVKEYPHDVTSYTQGLFFFDGQMYESTGQYGTSTFRKVDLVTGKPLRKLDFSKKYFVEGSVVFGNELYILTWTNKVVFIYDAQTLEYKRTGSYHREGWGLTSDGKSLVASDGSSNLYFLDAGLNLLKTLKVTLHGRPLRFLNELEYVDGKIYANVYTSDMVVAINPSDGVVEEVIDCSGLLPDSLRTSGTDVLNGIAYNEKTGKLYLTGKNWPRLYEVKLVEKK